MLSMPIEIRYIILQNMFDVHNTSLFSTLSVRSDTQTLSIRQIILWAGVCKEWYTYFLPFIRDIVQSPMKWALRYENREMFVLWVDVAKCWMLGVQNSKTKYIKHFVEEQRTTNKIVIHHTKNSDVFSFAVFSILEHIHPSEEFLKFVWMNMYNRDFFHPSLSSYYDRNSHNANNYRVCFNKISSNIMREELLKNNNTANILYYLDRYFLVNNVENTISTIINR